MSSYLVGTRLSVSVEITDDASDALVDPGALTFSLRPPSTSGYASSTYAWNGSTWTSSESTIVVPSKGAMGIFTLQVTIPYVNAAQGRWVLGWTHTANGGGLGHGSGEALFVVRPTDALST